MKTKQTLILLVLTLLGFMIEGGTVGAETPQTAPRVALQLWSVKDEIRRDIDGTLAKIAQLGFAGVEFAGQFGSYKNDATRLRALLDKNGLQCAGAHVNFGQLTPKRFDETTTFYRTLGCSNLIVPSDIRGATPEKSVELGDGLATLSRTLAATGMRIGYHNHAQEMAGTVGSTPWDVIARATPPEVILQQDVGWTVFAGKDPVAYVKRYPGRTVTTHFKAKLAAESNGKPIIGEDNIDWPSLIRAVREVGGTEWIIVEQEEYPNGMGQLEAAAASLRNLRAIMADGTTK